jgi:four helix bundle protein
MEEELKTKLIQNYSDLDVWKKGIELVQDIYSLTNNFPKSETYGLTSQVQRAAVSIPANIAEGFIKKSEIDKIRYLNIAQGSLEETRYYLILARDLKYGDTSTLFPLLEEVSKLLNAFIKSIKNSL